VIGPEVVDACVFDLSRSIVAILRVLVDPPWFRSSPRPSSADYRRSVAISINIYQWPIMAVMSHLEIVKLAAGSTAATVSDPARPSIQCDNVGLIVHVA
jgi:hypothetical protein